ncbi:undecaprenyl/decaprenyl-phosphate alpha-N-acetylglucosaminyl 1-phosphate transferase [Candidatus Peregrinibacteria bacterium]|nr:undecaprenyl/decaprenyl-phosphate alpha-N-acetylglucosaminyl 1-phosphate transferase [Candidatus Peregrinibacteria bacterium]
MIFACLLAVKFFPKLGLMDRPHRYGLSRAPIPYYGGILIYTVFLILTLCFVEIDRSVIALIAGATLIFVVGFLDDLYNLSPIIRLAVQFVAGVVLVIGGVGILSINLPLVGTLVLSEPVIGGVMILSALFTIFWVMALLNTMNFVDGIGGLSSGVTFVAGLTIFALSIHPGIHENPESQIGVATIALIIAMISFAFLLFDFPKPKILMGDSGSTLLGFLIAALAIFSGGKVATAFLVLGIPILDMIWVVVRRTLKGKKFWQGDLLHLHHRLLGINLSERVVVLIYLFVTALFGIFAVTFVTTEQKLFILAALVILMLLLATALVLLPRKKQ